ncbi:MAG TPA: hypothetical protein VJ792_02430 [Candidatus Nitrosotalea sp.]|nr:hypothetical protein [Candidatus Nitrosotalea sp.]
MKSVILPPVATRKTPKAETAKAYTSVLDFTSLTSVLVQRPRVFLKFLSPYSQVAVIHSSQTPAFELHPNTHIFSIVGK